MSHSVELRERAERAILTYLSEQPENTYLTHLEIGHEVWKINGGTLCASAIGSLLNRKLIKRSPYSRNRYAISEAGRRALALEDARRSA